MLSRNYTKLIEIWKTTTVPDGFSGNTVTSAVDFSVWANVTAKNATRLNENGQNDNFVQTVFTIRNRATLDISIKENFIKYNGLNYNIEAILNKDLDNIDIQLTATQRE